MVTKPDRGLKIVHEFLAVNKETLLQPYWMKNIQDSMEDLSQKGYKILSKIDLTFFPSLLQTLENMEAVHTKNMLQIQETMLNYDFEIMYWMKKARFWPCLL